jgi:DNA-binding response OmpR family regulator
MSEPAQILVVDDEETMRELSRVVLHSRGYRVLTAASAEAAIQILSDNEIDLVVSDVNMPTEDGFDLVRRARECKGKENVPFVFLTASMWSASGKQAALDLGVLKVIFRPIEIRAIITEIEECLPPEKRSSGQNL